MGVAEEMASLRETVSKLWGSFRELSADYWGPNKDNGRRSEIAELRRENALLNERVDSLENTCRHYFDAQRAETCYGKKLIAEHEKKHTEHDKGETEVEIQKGKNRTAIIQQWLILAGVIFSAVMAVVK